MCGRPPPPLPPASPVLPLLDAPCTAAASQAEPACLSSCSRWRHPDGIRGPDSGPRGPQAPVTSVATPPGRGSGHQAPAHGRTRPGTVPPGTRGAPHRRASAPSAEPVSGWVSWTQAWHRLGGQFRGGGGRTGPRPWGRREAAVWVGTRGRHPRSAHTQPAGRAGPPGQEVGPPDSGSSAHPADTPRGSSRLSHLRLAAEGLRPRPAGKEQVQKGPACPTPALWPGWSEAALLTSGSAERGRDGPASPPRLLPERVRRRGRRRGASPRAAARGPGRGQYLLEGPSRARLLQPAP